MALNDTYDIVKALDAIEDELIASMIRNMKKHKLDEIDEDKQWSMWQVEQLKSLEQYRRNNREKFGNDFKEINEKIEFLIRHAKDEGEMDQEIAILNAIKKGFKPQKATQEATAEFFQLNEEKLESLIKATTDDMKKAETAVLRMADDQYRKIIFNAQVYANSGAGTYEKAVDMAVKDMLAAGLNCVEYKNGARHTLRDYADMAIKTAAKRAYLQGEGEKRKEWGIPTVIVNKRLNPCPKCLPFCGKVFIDDVWSGGSKDGISPVTGLKYPLMSEAVAAGLYHPRCKDVHTTYFEGVNTPPDDKYTRDELDELAEKYRREQKQQYAKRQAEKFDRMSKFSLDPENQQKYKKKANMWKHIRFKTGDVDASEYIEQKRILEIREKFEITKQWIDNTNNSVGKLSNLMEYSVNETKYTVDDKHVVLRPNQNEIHVAEILSTQYGKTINMVPQIINPKGVSTPDYLIDGEKFDLKSPTGSGKNVLYGMISKNRKQASNFIFDISNCPLDLKEIERQVDDIYRSTHTLFVDMIILFKDDNVIKVYTRKK